MPWLTLALITITLLSGWVLAGCNPTIAVNSPSQTNVASLTTPSSERPTIIPTLTPVVPPATATLTVAPTATLFKTGLTPTPFVAPTSFAIDIYPPPLSVAKGVVWWVGQGCPNPTGLEKVSQLPIDQVIQVLTDFSSGELYKMRQASDPAYWALLNPGEPRYRPGSKDWITTPQPANASPYAEFLTNACGAETVEKSWWVQLCPGPCQDPNVTRAAALIGHAYLISRKGHWLIWAVE